MDINPLTYLLAATPIPAVVIDRRLTVQGHNTAASRLGLRDNQSLTNGCHLDLDERDMVLRCFGSSNKQRFRLRASDGRPLLITGWRLGGPLRAQGLVMLHLDTRAALTTSFRALTSEMRERRGQAALHRRNARLAKHNEDLRNLASRDAMTGLRNRLAFRLAMQQHVSAGKTFALLYLDMNGLKTLNDTLGHQAGDALICGMAKAIRDNARDDDIAARLGGDEFAIIATGRLDRAGLRRMGTRIMSALRDDPPDGLPPGYIASCAIGCAFWPQDSDSLGVLEHLADQAMYHSKRSGDDMVFATDLSMTSLTRLAETKTPHT